MLHIFTAHVQINSVGAGNPVLLKKLPVLALIENMYQFVSQKFYTAK